MLNQFENSNEKYEYKQSNFNISYSQYEAMQSIEKQNKEKYEKFKTRVKQFEEISTIEEAKELAKKILPIAGEKCSFRVGNAKCTIICKEDMFRVCVDGLEEFICYDFA